MTTESSEDHDDSVDQLLDDALEESYRSVLEETNEEVKITVFLKFNIKKIQCRHGFLLVFTIAVNH